MTTPLVISGPALSKQMPVIGLGGVGGYFGFKLAQYTYMMTQLLNRYRCRTQRL